jgi:hypothetical protein
VLSALFSVPIYFFLIGIELVESLGDILPVFDSKFAGLKKTLLDELRENRGFVFLPLEISQIEFLKT